MERTRKEMSVELVKKEKELNEDVARVCAAVAAKTNAKYVGVGVTEREEWRSERR